MHKITALAQKIEKTQSKLDSLKAQMMDLRLEALRQVKFTKVGATITLMFNNRVIKAKKNRYGRYRVTEGGQTMDSDYMGGIHDLRFALAMGAV